MDEKVPLPQTDTGAFQVHIDPDERIQLTWQQPNEHAAMAAFVIGDRVAFTCVFLSGRDAALDLFAASTAEQALEEMAGAKAAKVRLPPDRPLVALTPWPPTASDAEARRVLMWVQGLAVAFFERAADRHQPFSPN